MTVLVCLFDRCLICWFKMRRNGSSYSWSFWLITVGAFLAILVFIALNDHQRFGTVQMQRELLTDILRTPSSPPKNRTFQIIDPVDISNHLQFSCGSSPVLRRHPQEQWGVCEGRIKSCRSRILP